MTGTESLCNAEAQVSTPELLSCLTEAAKSSVKDILQENCVPDAALIALGDQTSAQSVDTSSESNPSAAADLMQLPTFSGF